MPTNWGGLIAPGLQALSSGMASGQIGRGNYLMSLQSQRLWEQAQAERRRRDMLTRMLMPSLFRDMGIQPTQAQQYMNQLPSGRTTDPTYSTGNPTGDYIRGRIGDSGSRALQIGGVGLSALGALGEAGMLGGAAATPSLAGIVAGAVPALPTSAIGGTGLAGMGGASALPGVAGIGGHGMIGALGALASNPLTWIAAGGLGAGIGLRKIGQGRRAANTLVQGTENPFGQQVLPHVLELQRTDRQAARQRFIEGYDQYLTQIQQSIQQGGNPARVAQQSLQNQDLRRTAERIAEGLGIPIQWGQAVGGLQ